MKAHTEFSFNSLNPRSDWAIVVNSCILKLLKFRKKLKKLNQLILKRMLLSRHSHMSNSDHPIIILDFLFQEHHLSNSMTALLLCLGAASSSGVYLGLIYAPVNSHATLKKCLRFPVPKVLWKCRLSSIIILSERENKSCLLLKLFFNSTISINLGRLGIYHINELAIYS